MSSKNQFKKIKVLTIDDMSEMRSSLKSMCDLLGIEKIDQAYDGEFALQQMKSTPYDLILCDYDLGKGKDGQQVLEEARHAQLLHSGAAFIMVTAEESLEFIMSVLEYQPDGYISKPVTYEELQKRMRAVLKRKAVFDDIYKAIDQANFEGALSACDKLIAEQPKLAMSTNKIKGKLLFDLERYDEAKKLYDAVIEERPVAWAKLGLAKCLHASGQSKETKKLLKDLIKTNDQFVECYDLLADILIEEHQLKEAQAVLQEAVKKSPKSALRQGNLAEVAVRNDDLEVALKAARKAVSLSKNSVHACPENFLNLARSSQTQLLSGGQREKIRSATEIKRCFDTVRKSYSKEKKSLVKMSFLEALTLQNQDNKEASQAKLESAKKVYDELDPEDAKDCVIDIARTYQSLDDVNTAVDILEDIDKKDLLDWEGKALLEKLKPLVKQPEEETLSQQQIIDNLNNRGVELFEQGDIRGAVDLFKQAAANPQAKLSSILNTVQAIIMLMQKEGYEQNEADICNELFAKIESLDKENADNPKVKKLKKMFKDLKK